MKRFTSKACQMRRLAASCLFVMSVLILVSSSRPWAVAHAGWPVGIHEGKSDSSLLLTSNRWSAPHVFSTKSEIKYRPFGLTDMNGLAGATRSMGVTPRPASPPFGTTLTVNKKLASGTPVIGAPITYEIEILSSHPTQYNHLTVTDTLPAGFVFVSATYVFDYGASGPNATAVLNSGASVLTIGEFQVPQGGKITISITGYFKTGGNKTNLVVVDDPSDPVPPPPSGTSPTNQASVSSIVPFNNMPVDLKIEKCVGPNSSCVSSNTTSFTTSSPAHLHYQITVTNTTAQDVYLGGLLTISDFLTNNSATPLTWSALNYSCSPANLCPDSPLPTTSAGLGGYSTATIAFKYDLAGKSPLNDAGYLPGNGSFKIEFDVDLTPYAQCAPATIATSNQARLDFSNGIQSLNDTIPGNNTSQPAVATTITTNLQPCIIVTPSPTPIPLEVDKTQISPAPSGGVNAASWNAPVTYQVKVKNLTSAALASVPLVDYIKKATGTPTFTATVTSGPTCISGCTTLTNPATPNPTIILDYSYATLWTAQIPSLGVNQQAVIQYTVKYVPTCETDAAADYIYNYFQAGSVYKEIRTDLLEAATCVLSVDKTKQTSGSIVFGQPFQYQVVYKNPSATAVNLFVRDVLSVKSNRYGYVPFDYSVNCSVTQGTITQAVTGPALPIVKNVTGAIAVYKPVGWRGTRLIDEYLNFGPGATLTCQVKVTASQPKDDNPFCQGADNPQLTTDDAQLDNYAYLDPNNFNENGSTAPVFNSHQVADLPLCRSVLVTKTATPHNYGPGATITYVITVQNKGDDAVPSLTLKDVVQPPLTQPMSVSACNPTTACISNPNLDMTTNPPHVDASYGLMQPGQTVSFNLTVTAPQAGGSYPNLAVGSFPPVPGKEFYFKGDPLNFLQDTESIQVLTPVLSKIFDPGQIAPNGSSTLTFNITNTNSDPKQTGISFSDTLPGLQITGVIANGCGGSVTTSTDGHTVTLAGGQLVGTNSDGSGKHSCQISVKVKASSECGVNENKSTNFSQVSNLDVSNINEHLDVVGCPDVKFPTLIKAYEPAKIAQNGSTTLAFTITNSSGDPKQTGIAFSDTLPPGLQIVGVVSNGCSGTVTISTDGQTVTLVGGQLGLGQHTCKIVVRVKASDRCGVYRNNEKNFSDVKNLDVSGIHEQLEVSCESGSGLVVEKVVKGAPYGFKGQFNFLVQCATPKGFYQKAVTVDWPTPGFTALTDVPAGSQCTVTEGPPPASLPASYNWAGLPAYLPQGGVISIGPKGGHVTVTDTLSPCNETGQVTITKVVEGLPKDFIGVFEGTLQCWVADKLVTYPVTLTSPNGLTTTIGNIPLGSTCTFQETGQAPLQGDLKWNQPIYSPRFGTVTLSGECCQQITVTNEARHCCSQTESSGSVTGENYSEQKPPENLGNYGGPPTRTPARRRDTRKASRE